MKRFIATACIVLATSTAGAAVSAHVYRADEQTPLPWADPNVPDVYRDIMVGTRLAIFITSDEGGTWYGELRNSLSKWAIGSVSGREEDPEAWGYEGSVLPAADHRGTLVADYHGPGDERGLWFDCAASTIAGEWFVVDYLAKAVGTCDLGLYAAEETTDLPSGIEPGPDDVPTVDIVTIQSLSFNHVPSRDLNLDDIVDFVDFALLADRWKTRPPDPNQLQATAVVDPNTSPSPDLNADDVIDTADLVLFCTYWLERTDVNQPAADPNAPGGAEQ